MSRWDSDLDHAEWLNGPDVPRLNATCRDCGADFGRADHDLGEYCDPCSDQRDAHTTATEIRLMAKAVLRADLTTIKEIA